MLPAPVNAIGDEFRDGRIQVAGISADLRAQEVVLIEQRVAQPDGANCGDLRDFIQQAKIFRSAVDQLKDSREAHAMAAKFPDPLSSFPRRQSCFLVPFSPVRFHEGDCVLAKLYREGRAID